MESEDRITRVAHIHEPMAMGKQAHKEDWDKSRGPSIPS